MTHKQTTYRMCARCIMDTTDPDITFDDKGICHHCTGALELAKFDWLPDARGAARLEKKLEQIRKAGRGKEFDCIIGLSGGTDSSYLVYKSKEWGLRPLLFHVDGGWNTPESENNVRNLADYLQTPLRTYTVNWEEMCDLQRAFLQSGVPNQDIPQDHLFFAVLFNLAKQMGIRYWLSGINFVGECILPGSWGHNAMDVRHLRDIHSKFGKSPLATFPMLPLWDYFQYYGLGLLTVERVDPLDWIPYHVEAARRELAEHCGWQNYGRKHCESYFTRYFQCHYLPLRFGFDKRKAHFSSCIVSGQMSREQALSELIKPLYDPEQLASDTAYISQKLGYTPAEWEQTLAVPTRPHSAYVTSAKYLHVARHLKTMQNALGMLARGDVSTFYRKLKNKVQTHSSSRACRP